MFDAAPYPPPDRPERIPTILFSARGAHPGPRLVVTGPQEALCAATERLFEITELVQMYGALELRIGEGFDLTGYADEVLHIAVEDRNAHLRILGRMASLGMIAGRGVPLRHIH